MYKYITIEIIITNDYCRLEFIYFFSRRNLNYTINVIFNCIFSLRSFKIKEIE